MADSFSKKEREKKKRKRSQEKFEKRQQRKLEGKSTEDIMYLDEFGNFTSTPPDPSKKREVKIEDIQVSIPKQSELEDSNTDRKGVVKFFNEEKRFGFIGEMDSDQDYFVHEENLIDRIRDRDKVIFDAATGPKGLIAINVRLFEK